MRKHRADYSLIPRRAGRPQREMHTDEVPMMNFRRQAASKAVIHDDAMPLLKQRLIKPSRSQEVLADISV